jgi:hypothetical protein
MDFLGGNTLPEQDIAAPSGENVNGIGKLAEFKPRLMKGLSQLPGSNDMGPATWGFGIEGPTLLEGNGSGNPAL